MTQLNVELQTGDTLVVHALNDDRSLAGLDPGAELVVGWATEHSYVIGSGAAAEPSGAEVKAA